jgi:hypothetical protein
VLYRVASQISGLRPYHFHQRVIVHRAASILHVRGRPFLRAHDIPKITGGSMR